MDKTSRIKELLEVCKNYQGAYLPADHGSGSWATTYSDEFIKASADLFYLLEGFQAYKEFQLSQMFIENKILSCRGSEMTFNRVSYLYQTHIKHILEKPVKE